MTLTEINEAIKQLPDSEKNLVSDGYHTFEELYEHRIALFVALCKELVWEYRDLDVLARERNVHLYPWKSKLHYDGTMYEGWFIAGIGTKKGETLTYHLPISWWNKLNFYELDKAPEWDGHTSKDVIRLLGNL